MRTQDGCAGHAGLGAEVRGIAVAVLDRLEPALDRVRAGEAPAGAGTCGVCPVCAVIAALHQERPELAARVAEQAASMLAVLRAALEEGDPAAQRPPETPAETAPEHRASRPVQRIKVDRAAR